MSLGKVAQSVMPPTLSEHLLILAEHPFLLAELPLRLFARRDTVIANHAFSVSSHETVISCPAFPIMVISIMINSCSAPLGTKTTIAVSTRYGLVLAAIGRVGCCVVAEVCGGPPRFAAWSRGLARCPPCLVVCPFRFAAWSRGLARAVWTGQSIISRRGFMTKSRSCISGWGMCRSGSSMCRSS